ncbi:MAG: GreA/GreB family elongation factor [Burkholderiaceae bacterium]|nr:GreA/GreB family elongation factor [Burkholderiaceae bacterium]
MEVTLVERTLTELDHVRLLNLLRRAARGEASAPPRRTLEDVLDGSTTVPTREVAPEVVTMRSQILLRDLRTGQRNTLTLCYPAEADPAVGLVSVLSPIGSALIGMHAGSVARWFNPSGGDHAAEIVAVLFQPESSGDYTA